MSTIITSNLYLAVFSAGTLIGAASTYFILRFRYKPSVTADSTPSWLKDLDQRYQFDNVKDEVRLMLGVRNDLKMQKGKVAAQCAHAAMSAYANTLHRTPELLTNWLRTGGTKITVRVESEKELLELDKKAKQFNVLSCIIQDAGQTQVKPGTRTVIAIGPAPKSILDNITGNLKLY